MNRVFDPTNPDLMSAEDRLTEVATILASGVLRLHRRAAIPAPDNHSAITPESDQNCLADIPTTRPHGQRG